MKFFYKKLTQTQMIVFGYMDEYLKMIRQIPRTGKSNFLTYSHG